MQIRSEIEIPPRDLRLLHLADNADTEAYVEAHSVVRTHPNSGATSTILAYELNGSLYRAVPLVPPHATVSHDGRSLVPFTPSDHETVKDDCGARYEHGQRTATI